MSEKKMVSRNFGIASAVALILTLSLLWGLPYIFSAATGVPVWYLSPHLIPLSMFPSEGVMNVKVNPMAPTMNGQLVTVTVLDANNNTPIGNALVDVDEGSYGTLNMTTGSDGTAQFALIGFTTQISVSKDGYADSNTIVIPHIPAEWVNTLNYQYITWVVTIICAWGPAILTILKTTSKNAHPKKKKVHVSSRQ
jgi:hypothetical protein